MLRATNSTIGITGMVIGKETLGIVTDLTIEVIDTVTYMNWPMLMVGRSTITY